MLLNRDFHKPFLVSTGTTDTQLGAVLMQTNAARETHPIVYSSKKLLPQEQNYVAIAKESLEMGWALKKRQPYLFGQLMPNS